MKLRLIAATLAVMALGTTSIMAEGLKGMPKRQFIGDSKTLFNNIKKEIDRLFNQLK